MNIAQETTDRPQYPNYHEGDREVSYSETTAERFALIVRSIEGFESRDRLLDEILATLKIARNREQLMARPAENLPKFFEVADEWARRRASL